MAVFFILGPRGGSNVVDRLRRNKGSIFIIILLFIIESVKYLCMMRISRRGGRLSVSIHNLVVGALRDHVRAL